MMGLKMRWSVASNRSCSVFIILAIFGPLGNAPTYRCVDGTVNVSIISGLKPKSIGIMWHYVAVNASTHALHVMLAKSSLRSRALRIMWSIVR